MGAQKRDVGLALGPRKHRPELPVLALAVVDNRGVPDDEDPFSVQPELAFLSRPAFAGTAVPPSMALTPHLLTPAISTNHNSWVSSEAGIHH